MWQVLGNFPSSRGRKSQDHSLGNWNFHLNPALEVYLESDRVPVIPYPNLIGRNGDGAR